VIVTGKQAWVCTGRLLVLCLRWSGCDMLLIRRRPFLSGRPSRYASAATVEADAGDIRIIDDYGFVIDVADVDGAEIVDSSIVGEDAVVPISALVAYATITETIVDAAVKADVRTPITRVPNIKPLSPTPVARRPKQPD
jgi:hypothetical protein